MAARHSTPFSRPEAAGTGLTADAPPDAEPPLSAGSRQVRGLIGQRCGAPRETSSGHFFEIAWHEQPLPAGQGPVPMADARWLVADLGPEDTLATELAEALTAAGARCELVAPEHIAEAARAGAGGLVLCADPAAGPELSPGMSLGLVRNTLAALREQADAPGNCPVWLLTRGARAVAPGDAGHPDAAALGGFARVVMRECPGLRLTPADADPAAGAGQLLPELAAGPAGEEVAWRGGVRYVARLVPAPPAPGGQTWPVPEPVAYGEDVFRLRPGDDGTLDGLRLVREERRAPGPGQVEVRVSAACLDFRDVMNALGLLPAGSRRRQLGSGFAGTVTAVGPAVEGFLPGDRVVGVGDGASGSFVVTTAALLRALPEGMTAAQAAALPTAYLTAWYALCHQARLAPGRSVLVHAASGGVGLAAVALARRCGARVLATAGSEKKRRWLRELGVEHVMDSRTLAFVDDVRRITGGRGVDAVLNSLAGAAGRAGPGLLAPGGHFVEIGNQDVTPMPVPKDGVTFSRVLLDETLEEYPEFLADRLGSILGDVAAGRLPMLPCREFPLEQAAEAMRAMAAAEHIGRLVLTVPGSGATRALPPRGSSPAVRPGTSYIISGGLRGLGLQAAEWLARHGAGRIVLGGRSHPLPEAAARLDRVRAAGTEIRIVLGDIAADRTAGRLVAAAVDGGRRLAGVLHTAGVPDGGPASRLTDERVGHVWRPKAEGAWRLHLATLGHRPDWWVAFSSAATLVGTPGQAAGAAADAWLDAFAAWRRSRGLPALSVSWGPWRGGGAVRRATDEAYAAIGVDEGFRALEQLLTHDRTWTGVFRLDARPS
ncbi:SDR family NAD(P)-dependent oxidoreductase [Streptomyces sp. NPDC051162]|uniref:SDR family NAD(P)-dependent oxidoreductase n=1 Tax=Streptomyces sp. NPDC051162 TaxID=3154747 RepID=UPI003421DCED